MCLLPVLVDLIEKGLQPSLRAFAVRIKERYDFTLCPTCTWNRTCHLCSSTAQTGLDGWLSTPSVLFNTQSQMTLCWIAVIYCNGLLKIKKRFEMNSIN